MYWGNNVQFWKLGFLWELAITTKYLQLKASWVLQRTTTSLTFNGSSLSQTHSFPSILKVNCISYEKSWQRGCPKARFTFILNCDTWRWFEENVNVISTHASAREYPGPQGPELVVVHVVWVVSLSDGNYVLGGKLEISFTINDLE